MLGDRDRHQWVHRLQQDGREAAHEQRAVIVHLANRTVRAEQPVRLGNAAKRGPDPFRIRQANRPFKDGGADQAT
jgi:hypothetical protein